MRSGIASCAASVSTSPEWIDALTPTMSAISPANRSTRALATTDDERRTARRVRPRRAGQLGDAVVLALEGDRRLVDEQRLQDLRVLDHPVDAHLRRLHRDAGTVVVELLPPRAEPDLEPALRQQVDRRELTREHRGMAVVAVEHERADVQRGREHGGRAPSPRSGRAPRRSGRGRTRRVPERLELADGVGPRAPSSGPWISIPNRNVCSLMGDLSVRPGRRACPSGTSRACA